MTTTEKGIEAVTVIAGLVDDSLDKGQETAACLLAAAGKLIELWEFDADDVKLVLANQLVKFADADLKAQREEEAA